MVLPAVKGGPKIIEEIALSIALPTIYRISPGPFSGSQNTPDFEQSSQIITEPSELKESEFPETVKQDMRVPMTTEKSDATEKDGTIKIESISNDIRQIPRKIGRLPQAPQVTVIKMDELDMDAPPDFDQLKMNLINVPQTQVIVMGDESKSNKPDEPKTDEEKKIPPPPQDQAHIGVGQVALQMPPGVKQIYTVDPNVIKRLQWRLARMEDFETSIGIAVAEIKEAIAKAETTRLELEEMRKGYATVEKTMHELAALYDLISASVNPFIDSDQEQQTISTKIMKRSFGMDSTGTASGQPSGGLLMPIPSFGSESSTKKKDEKSTEDYNIDTWTVKWAEFLLERVPKSKINALLDHYIEIGWLDEEVKARVEETIKGINEINLGIHVSDEAETEEDRKKLDWWKLPIDDHVKSLQFIEKIRGGGRGGGFTPSTEDQKKKR